MTPAVFRSAWFLLLLVLWLGLFGVLLELPLIETYVVGPYVACEVSVSRLLLQPLGLRTTAVGPSLVGETGLTLKVARECDASDVIAVFAALVLAFPAPWRHRVIAAALGALALATVNVLRVVSLYYALAVRPEWFETLHIRVWQTLLVLLTLLMWFAWASRALKRVAQG